MSAELPSLRQLQCLLHLPAALFSTDAHQEKSEATKSLLLPDKQDALNCLQKNHQVSPQRILDDYKVKFCFARLGINLGNFLGTSGDEDGNVRVSLNAGVCLPESCTAEDLASLASFICALPECNILMNPSLVEACGNAQLALCGPNNRLEFQHSLDLDCVADAPRSFFTDAVQLAWHELRGTSLDSSLMSLAQEFEGLTNNKAGHRPQETETRRHLQSNRPETRLSFEQLTTLTDCGSSSFRQWQGQIVSAHKLQDYGDFTHCEKDDDTSEQSSGVGHFCLVQFLTLLGQGRCVPQVCHSQTLTDLLEMTCQFNEASAPTLEFPFRGRSCLDFVNLIPLDLCLAGQLFGCGDVTRFESIGSNNTVSSIFNVALHNALMHPNHSGHDRMLQLKSLVNSVVSPLVAPAITNTLESLDAFRLQSMLDEFSQNERDIRQRSLSGVSTFGSKEGAGKPVPLVTAHCNYSSRSLAVNLGLGIPVSLSLGFFVVLPAMAWIFKRNPNASGPRRRQPSEFLDRFWEQVKTLGGHFREVIRCFDLCDNYKSFWRNSAKMARGIHPHLAGMRVLSMLWIILGHSFTSSLFGALIQDLSHGLHMATSFDFQFIVSGVFSVDTFFFFTGFLLGVYGTRNLETSVTDQLNAAVTAKEEETDVTDTDVFLRQDMPSPKMGGTHNRQRILSRWDVLKVYLKVFFTTILHRYIRLAGVYLFVLALWIFAVPHIASGPMLPVLIDFVLTGPNGGCRKNWWANVLFINNVYPPGGLSDCMGWSWYLANDYQFFVVSTILLLIRHKSKRAFKAAVVILFFGTYVASFAAVLQNAVQVSRLNLSFGHIAQEAGNLIDPFTRDQDYYIRPWCRFAPHLIGLLVGLLTISPGFESWFARFLFAKPLEFAKDSSTTAADSFLLEAVDNSLKQTLQDKPSESASASAVGVHEVSDAMLGGIIKSDDEPTLERENTLSDRTDLVRNEEVEMRSLSRSPVHRACEPESESECVAVCVLRADSRVVVAFHMLAFAVMLTLVFITYVPNNISDNERAKPLFPKSDRLWWPRWLDVFYSVFSRSIWALCVAWFVVSITLVRSSRVLKSERNHLHLNDEKYRLQIKDSLSIVIRAFLSLPVFTTLSNLVYVAYLLHPGLQQVYYGANLSTFYITKVYGYFSCISWAAVSFALAFPCVLMIEIALGKVARVYGI